MRLGDLILDDQMKLVTTLGVLFFCATPGAAAQLVRGQVVDSTSGEPVSHSTVILAGPTGAQADRTVSDARGFYLLRAPRPGRYQLIVEHEAYRRSSFPPFDLASEMRSFVLQVVSLDAALQLPDRATLTLAAARCSADIDAEVAVIVGAVTDAVTGERVSGASVYHTAPISTAEGADSVSLRAVEGLAVVETDEDGIYAVCDAPVVSRIAVHAVSGDSRSGFEALLFGRGGVFVGGAFRRLTQRVWRQDLELYPADEQTTTLVGAVTDTVGNAMAGAVVQISGSPYETRTDDVGRFEFANLTEGEVRVLARQVGFSPVEFDVDLPAGQTVNILGEMLALGRLPLRLEDINVVGESLRNNPRLSSFFARRDTYVRGKFATRDDWKTWMHFDVTSILNRTRYSLEKPSRWVCPDTIPISYFLDGAYLPFTEEIPIDEIVDPSWIDAVEAYGHGFDAPTRYRRRGCGTVILIWTRQ